MLSQRPADGLVDKEFLRIQILANDLAQQIEICLPLVVELEQDACTPEAEVIRGALFGEVALPYIGKSLEVDSQRAA